MTTISALLYDELEALPTTAKRKHIFQKTSIQKVVNIKSLLKNI